MKNVIGTFLLAGLIGLAGCSSTRQASELQRPFSPIPERLRELQRDRALAHVIQGSVYDVTGDYASAILEYQEALQHAPSAAVEYAISKDYSLLGKHALAADHGRAAVRLDSMKILYHENLAHIYLNAFQPELAVREYERIVRIDSNDADGLFNLARLYQPTRPLKALEIYERMLDRDGDDWELLFQTAQIYTSLGKYDQAAEKFKRMVDLDPSNRVVQRQLAETYVRAGKTPDAIKVLQNLIETDANDQESIAALADIYLDQHEYDKAQVLYQKLLAEERTNPEILLRVGMAYMGQAQRDSTFARKAKPIFEQLKTQTPNDWRPYFYLGLIADQEKQDTLADAYFGKVTHLADGNGDVWWYIGSSYFEKGEYQKLLDAMQIAQKALPKDSRIFFLLGLGYSRSGQTDEAVVALRRSLELKPDDMNTISELALTLDGLHRYEQSDSLYERALRIDPQSALVLNNYGYSLAERGLQLERALQMSLQAIKAEPHNASYLDTVGWVYFKLGKYDEAQQYIARSIAENGASATVYEHMGDIQYKLGEKDKAENYWRKSLQMDTTNQALRDKIARGSL